MLAGDKRFARRFKRDGGGRTKADWCKLLTGGLLCLAILAWGVVTLTSLYRISPQVIVGQKVVATPAPTSPPTPPPTAAPTRPPTPLMVVLYDAPNCNGSSFSIPLSENDDEQAGCIQCFDSCNAKWAFGATGKGRRSVKSVSITGTGHVDVYRGCKQAHENKDTNFEDYFATVYARDGCVPVTSPYSWSHFRFRPGYPIAPRIEAPNSPAIDNDNSQGNHLFRVTFSAESSFYMAYQVQASFHQFLETNQEGTYTRLLTAREHDDFARDYVPTVTAKRHPYSNIYAPLNKPDVYEKWLWSNQAPTEEIIVILDPDSFLLKDLTPYAKKVSRGHAIAVDAFFKGANAQTEEMWMNFCPGPPVSGPCEGRLDLVGVPYVIHRDDLRAVAPLWKYYTIAIKEKIRHDADWGKRYDGVGLGWTAEMYGYIFAAKHLGIKHTIENSLQIRDVDSRRPSDNSIGVASVHMGRAWFPEDYEPGNAWRHTEGRDFARYGNQVWCKCNVTAVDIIPWPLPPAPWKIDIQSRVTLTALHESRERWGKPAPSKYLLPGGQKFA